MKINEIERSTNSIWIDADHEERSIEDAKIQFKLMFGALVEAIFLADDVDSIKTSEEIPDGKETKVLSIDLYAVYDKWDMRIIAKVRTDDECDCECECK